MSEVIHPTLPHPGDQAQDQNFLLFAQDIAEYAKDKTQATKRFPKICKIRVLNAFRCRLIRRFATLIQILRKIRKCKTMCKTMCDESTDIYCKSDNNEHM